MENDIPKPLPDDAPKFEWAKLYASLGLAPVRLYGVTAEGRCQCGNEECKAPGKHPVPVEWQKRATCDEKAVWREFTPHRGNIGCYLGSKFVLIDADGPEGMVSLKALGAAEGGMPPTAYQISGSGAGMHLIYRLAPGQDAALITDRPIAPKLDVKIRGQFVAAPSRHKSGNQYRWISLALGELPDWLYQKLIRRPAAPPASVPAPSRDSNEHRIKRLRAVVAKIKPAISGQGGHHQTWDPAKLLGAEVRVGNISRAQAWELLCEYNQRCEPPWSEYDLEHKLRDGIEKGRGKPLADRPTKPPATRPALESVCGGQAVATDAEVVELWRAQLIHCDDKRKGLLRVPANARVILQHHDYWKGRIRFDDFSQRCLLRSSDGTWKEISDTDITSIMEWLLRAERLQLADKLVNIAVDDVGQRCRVSVLRDWLEGLKWDGTARIETWLATYIGAADTPYHRAVGKWWLISAVARGVKPGCKADHAIVLEGGQGIGKSSALRTLAGEDWFSDTAADLSTKDAMQDLPGNWIIELGELAALRRTSDIQAVKFFLSKCDDKYRPSYGRRSVRVPRQCVFAGTINDDEYLMDETGNRRFWPVRCGTIDLEGLARDRDQLWAEAVALYRAGERWWPLRGEEAMCATEQERRTTDPTDPWLQPIAEWIQANAIRETTIWDVLERCLKVGGLSCGKREQMRVGKCLKALGFMRALSGPERVTKWSN